MNKTPAPDGKTVERVLTLPGWELHQGPPLTTLDTAVYAAFATWYGQRVVRLEHHLSRLQDSAQRVGITTVLDTRRLRVELAAILQESGFPEARIRVTLTDLRTSGGAGAALIVRMEPYNGPPTDEKALGVACGLLSGVSRKTPEAKRADWIEERSRATGERQADFYEWLLADKNSRITEGTSSNFYLVAGDSTGNPILLTAGAGILAGTARAIVLEVAPSILPVRMEAPTVSHLSDAQEAFISSASRGIVPVTEIDGRSIGTGVPGPLTVRLMQAFDQRAEQLAVPLIPVAE